MRRRKQAKPTSRPAAAVGSAVSATEAQNNFGDVLRRAARDDVVYITRHARPTAVVLSIERYNELAGRDVDELDDLAREFDDMVARMQTAAAAEGIAALFMMEPEDLGEAAARAAAHDED